MDSQSSPALSPRSHENEPGTSNTTPKPSSSTPITNTHDVSPPKKRKLGAFSINEKNMILNVYKYVKHTKLEEKSGESISAMETSKGNKTECVLKTSEILGITRSSTYKLLKENKENECLSAPAKTGPKLTFKDKVDDFTLNAIRQKVHGFFKPPTVAKVPTTYLKFNYIPHSQFLPQLYLWVFQLINRLSHR